MAKNKKGGLIEDRVIRNPMEQMRRKLKFKAKKERKELRLFAKSLKTEHKHIEKPDNNVSLKGLVHGSRKEEHRDESENEESFNRPLKKQPY